MRVAVLLSVFTAPVSAQCVGDCNENGAVAINELVLAVNIALGSRNVADCLSADANGNGAVTVNELIQAVRNALNGCAVVVPTPTATGVATPVATETPLGPTPTATVASGPRIVFFGLTAPDDTLLPPSGEEGGIPVFVLPQGRAFHIVVEAAPSTITGPSPGLDTFCQGCAPSFQILSSNPLGNGSAQVCDAEPPDAGGVPAVSPPSFDGTPEVEDALNDFGCRFQDGGDGMPNPITSGRGCNVQTACVRFDDGVFGCVADTVPPPRLQYCSADISVIEDFPVGDTVLSARVLDESAARNPGPIEQIIVRVAPPFPG